VTALATGSDALTSSLDGPKPNVKGTNDMRSVIPSGRGGARRGKYRSFRKAFRQTAQQVMVMARVHDARKASQSIQLGIGRISSKAVRNPRHPKAGSVRKDTTAKKGDKVAAEIAASGGK